MGQWELLRGYLLAEGLFSSHAVPQATFCTCVVETQTAIKRKKMSGEMCRGNVAAHKPVPTFTVLQQQQQGMGGAMGVDFSPGKSDQEPFWWQMDVPSCMPAVWFTALQLVIWGYNRRSSSGSIPRCFLVSFYYAALVELCQLLNELWNIPSSLFLPCF